jgi:hypothetical protein
MEKQTTKPKLRSLRSLRLGIKYFTKPYILSKQFLIGLAAAYLALLYLCR